MDRKIFYLVLGMAFVFGVPAMAQDVHLNELYVSHAGTDDMEFVELIGTPNMSLDYYMVLVIEGENTSSQGNIIHAYDLTGYAIPADGYFVLGDTAVPAKDYDMGASNKLQNGTETFYLVDAGDQVGVDAILAYSGTTDPEGDLITVIPTMATIVDIIGMVNSDYPAEDVIYDGAAVVGPDMPNGYFPAGILRSGDYPNDWCPDVYPDYDDFVNAIAPSTAGAMNIVVQENIGFMGPGYAHLMMFGDALATGGTADLVLMDAPALTQVALFAGLTNTGTAIMDGFLVPFPADFIVFLSTDADGMIVVNDYAGGAPVAFTAYAQFLYADGSLVPYGVGFSNALQIEILP